MKEKAKALWLEHKNTLGLLIYSPQRKAGYRTRVKNLAKEISKSSTEPDNTAALMYLGHIELWLDIDLHQYLKD